MPIKNTPRINPKKKEYWEAKIKEWSASGLSKILFCKERGITGSAFGKWYKRLVKDLQKNTHETSFVPIKIKNLGIKTESPLYLLLKHDIKVSIPNDVNRSTLKMLLEMLGVLPC